MIFDIARAVIQEIGSLFSSWIIPLLDFMREDYVGAGLAFAVLMLGATVFLTSACLWIRDWLKVRKALGVLEGIDSRDDLAREYNRVNQEMAEIPRVGAAWGEFCETMIPPKLRGENLIPAENTVRPQSFLNSVELKLGPNFLQVWPNVFVGIGLMITFLGLIAALTQASATMEEALGDAQKVQDAVQGLLNVAAAKFYASLVALFISVLLTLWLRLYSSVMRRHLTQLNNKIEHAVRFVTQEGLASRANELIEEQLVQLKTFNTDLAIKIGENITQAIQPMLQEITQNNERITDQQVGALRSIGEEVSNSISGASQDAMERVAVSLNEVSGKLESLGDILTSSLAGFDAQLQQSMNALSEALKTTMDGVANDLGESVSSMAPKIQESLSSVTNTMDELQGKIADYANEGSAAVGAAISEATGAASTLIAESGNEFAQNFQQATSGVLLSLDGLAHHLKTLDESLGELPEKLSAVSASLTTSADSMSGASSQFTSASTGLRSVIEPLAQFATENREALETISASISSTSETLSASAEKIEGSVAQLNEAVQQRLGQLQQGDEALERYVDGINSSTERVLERIASFVQSTDGGFRDAIGQLQGAIGDLETVAEQLASTPSNNRGDS